MKVFINLVIISLGAAFLSGCSPQVKNINISEMTINECKKLGGVVSSELASGNVSPADLQKGNAKMAISCPQGTEKAADIVSDKGAIEQEICCK